MSSSGGTVSGGERLSKKIHLLKVYSFRFFKNVDRF